jgi:palmitoyltransferase ZDHHC3/7/25
MSAMVWVLMLYSAFTVTALTITEGIPVTLGMIYALLVFMALASHAKTSFTDPGSVPVQAIPSERQRLLRDSHSMCGQCQTFKPPGSHHCRICNRCISRMDHHCPWMNNCVGAGNLKHFCLFLFYTWLCAAYSLLLFGWNYFFCSDEDCTFHPVVLHLVRLMTLLAIGAFLFTSSMLMNVCYGIMTGIGTIDRLKKKATNTMSQSDEEPIQLIDVFGVGGYYSWFIPIDPIFEEYDRVMGFTIPSRLDRERQFCDLVMFQQQQNNNMVKEDPNHHDDIKTEPSMDFPNKCVNDLLPV